MKKMFLIVLLQMAFLASCTDAFADAESKNIQIVINKSIGHYNNKQFMDSLAELETIKNGRNEYTNWYYYYAINQTRLKNYDEAIPNLETYIKNSNVDNTAKAYYYIGLIQFYKGEYEKALNSLDLSLDVSTDPKLDTMSENLIGRIIRYQNYFETNKKTNLLFLLGYNYDTNAVNLSQNSFTDNLTGHVLGYGASISHKVIDRYSFIFEPTIAVLDNYTFNSKFAANSTVQSTDALQILLSLPIRFYFENEKLPNKFDLSLNAYNVYLPISTTTRELSISSIFVKAQVVTPYSTNYSVKYNTSIASDKSRGFTSDDDNASGLRFDFLTTFVNYLSQEDNTNIFYDLGISYSSTTGINTKYKKYLAGVGYMYPSFSNTNSSVRLGYHYLNYSEKVSPRTDNQLNLSYGVSKNLQENSTLGFSLTYVNNSSNTELNKYSDVTAGLQYTKSIGF